MFRSGVIALIVLGGCSSGPGGDETPPNSGGNAGVAADGAAGTGGTFVGKGGTAGSSGTGGTAGHVHEHPPGPDVAFVQSELGCGGALGDLALGDLTRDGVPDAVLATTDHAVCIVSAVGSALIESKGPTLGGAPLAIAIGDTTGDAIEDLVALLANGVLQRFAGNADGSFGKPTEVAFAPESIGLAVGDVDGDGAADVLVGETPGELVYVLSGPSLEQMSSFDAYPHPKRLVLGNLDGDAFVDVVVKSDDNENVVPCPGAGDGTFDSSYKWDEPCCVNGGTGHALAVGDFDDNGVSDYADSLVGPAPALGGNIANASLTWSQPGTIAGIDGYNLAMGFAVPDMPIPMLAAADFTGDGSAELVMGTDRPEEFYVVDVDTPGEYPSSFVTHGNHFHILRAGDVTGDGRADIVGATPGGVVAVFRNESN